MRRPIYLAAVLAVVTSFTVARNANAQCFPNSICPIDWLPAGTDNYNVNTNWSSTGFAQDVPSAAWDQTANIINGGTAQVTDSPPNVGEIAVGPGALEVLNGGNLSAVAGQLVTGSVDVASGGTLSVASGGTLAAGSLRTSGTGTLRLSGDVDGDGNAAVSVTNTLALGATGTLTAEITAADHPPILVGGGATLGGTVDAQFNGVAPVPGNSWDLIDATNLLGSFSGITSNVTLGAGQSFAIRETAGGVNGMLAQLVLEQRLSLSVDRQSKIASINNPGTGEVSIDGYRIESAVGSINPIPWSSFEDQQLDGGTWDEGAGGGTANQLAELNPDSSRTLGNSATESIGAVFQPNFVTLGQETEDLLFTYTTPTGEIVQGPVDYVGRKQHNNLVLVVDPASGAGRMQNESEISVDIDGYTITSAAGSLLDTWNSLEDQGAAGGSWDEANPSASQLAELQEAGITTLNQGDGFDLGTLFNTTLSQDLQVEFLLSDSEVGFEGVVQYEALASAIDGDYSNNSIVALEDLNLVLFNWNHPGAGLAMEWVNFRPSGNVGLPELNGVLFNWGNMASVATVPEPASLVLLLPFAVFVMATRNGVRTLNVGSTTRRMCFRGRTPSRTISCTAHLHRRQC